MQYWTLAKNNRSQNPEKCEFMFCLNEKNLKIRRKHQRGYLKYETKMFKYSDDRK